MSKTKNNLNTSTELLYEALADPSKLKPLITIAKVVNKKVDTEEEEEESFIDQIGANANESPKVSFDNSESKKRKNSSEKKQVEKDKTESSESGESSESSKNAKLPINSPVKFEVQDDSNKLKIDLDNKFSSKSSSSSRFGNYSSRLSSRRRNDINILGKNIDANLNKFINSDTNIRHPSTKPINSNNEFKYVPSAATLPLPAPQTQQTQQTQQTAPIPQIKPSIATEKEIKFKKMECLAKLLHMKNNCGIELTKNYDRTGDLEEMEAEIKFHTDIQSKKDGIQLCKSFMCNAITGLEYFNTTYDPFGFKLNGWSDQVKMNKDDFDSVFGELLEKYKGEGKKMEPEMKLAMMLVISGGSFHMQQTMAQSLPGVDELIKNNPQLMAKVQSNINKSISGPTDFEKKKQVYDNIKKMHDQKMSQKAPIKIIQQQNVLPNQRPNSQSNQLLKQVDKLNKQLNTQPNIQFKQTNKLGKQVEANKLAKQVDTDKLNQTILKSAIKPTSVKSLLQDIKKSIPLDSLADSYSITVGDTLDTETTDDSNDKKPTVSSAVKTKSRLAQRNIAKNN